jgi:hypothetical protein
MLIFSLSLYGKTADNKTNYCGVDNKLFDVLQPVSIMSDTVDLM